MFQCAQKKKRELEKYDDYNAQNKYDESPKDPWFTTTHDAYGSMSKISNRVPLLWR